MKKTLLILSAIGILLFTSCEKDELVAPQEKLKPNKVDCNCGGGSWDVKEPEPKPEEGQGG